MLVSNIFNQYDLVCLNEVIHKIENDLNNHNIDRINFSSMGKNKFCWMPPVSRSIFSIMFPQPQKTMRTNIIERQDAGQASAPRTPVQSISDGGGQNMAQQGGNTIFYSRHPFFEANIVQII